MARCMPLRAFCIVTKFHSRACSRGTGAGGTHRRTGGGGRTLSGGTNPRRHATRLRTKTIILAMGVEWRRMAVESIDRFIGGGVYYGAARSDAGPAQGEGVDLGGG